MGSCVETAGVSGCATRAGRTKMKEGVVLVYLLWGCTFAMGLMVMDESSCVEVEEEECGYCHTIYMEECKMKMIEEMMPAKISVCKNVTRYENKCKTMMDEKMVEEERPICRIDMMNKNHTACEDIVSPITSNVTDPCRPVMKCKVGVKKMKKKVPKTKCEKIAVGEEEKCFDTVQLKKEKHEAKRCSFHPKTVCKKVDGMKCKMVKKKMCDYVDNKNV